MGEELSLDPNQVQPPLGGQVEQPLEQLVVSEPQHIEHSIDHGEQGEVPQSLDLQTDYWTKTLAEAPIYKKFGKVNASVAQGGETIKTILADGTEETTNTTEEGDVIVTNPGGERYILKPDNFSKRYESTEEEGVFRAKGKARITPNTTGKPIKIKARWGEEQLGGPDALIATVYDSNRPDEVGADRYIIGRDEFNATYVPDTYEDNLYSLKLD